MITGPQLTDDKGPFIGDQRMRLLREQKRPRRFVGSSAFAAERQANEDRDGTNRGGITRHDLAGHWDPVPRDQVAANTIPDNPLGRTVIVNDAGLGKSTTVQWLRWEYSRPASNMLAFCIDISRLKALAALDAQVSQPHKLSSVFVETILLNEFCLPEGESSSAVAPQAGVKLLERLISAGRVVLLFDGLDHASDEAVDLLSWMLKRSFWTECRIVITSRPYALDQHWQRLFDSPDESPGWRFVRLDEFTTTQQEAYLGNERLDLIPDNARPILTVPRALYYLHKLTVAELAQVRTASDVYYLATQRMIDEALAAAHAGSLTGEMARRLLAMIAFHMVSQDANFDAVSGLGSLARLRGAVGSLCAAYAERRDLRGTFDEDWVTGRLMELAAMNDILDCGLLERGCPSHYQFRNRSLQEFFVAQFLASYCTDAALPLVEKMLYWEANRESARFRNVWRMFADMPRAAHDADCWLTSASVLYRPGTGQGQTTRRPTELIYHTWSTVERYHSGGSTEIQSRAGKILGEFQSEFSRILTWRNSFTGWWGWWRRRVARRLVRGFVTIPAGEFQMGSPDSEAGRDANERAHRVRITRDFLMHRYQLTNAAYELFDPAHAARRDQSSNECEQPVVYVSWYDAWCFAKWVCWNNKCCRLPTEAEWEYSCRAGTTTPFHFGEVSDGMQSNIDGKIPYGTKKKGKCLEKTSRVGSYAANGFQLCDMHGNVWEWCEDWYGENPRGLVADPSGPCSGNSRVLRGGTWYFIPRCSRSAFRYWGSPNAHSYGLGFRLARTP